MGKLSCQFKEQCPSYSGWCDGPKQDFSKCVEFIVGAYNNLKNSQPNIFYECDKRECERCSGDNCCHTTNIRHAKNFQLVGSAFVEVGD